MDATNNPIKRLRFAQRAPRRIRRRDDLSWERLEPRATRTTPKSEDFLTTDVIPFLSDGRPTTIVYVANTELPSVNQRDSNVPGSLASPEPPSSSRGISEPMKDSQPSLTIVPQFPLPTIPGEKEVPSNALFPAASTLSSTLLPASISLDAAATGSPGTNSSASNASDNKPATATIAGAVVGSVGGITVLLLIALIFYRWNRRRKRPEVGDEHQRIAALSMDEARRDLPPGAHVPFPNLNVGNSPYATDGRQSTSPPDEPSTRYSTEKVAPIRPERPAKSPGLRPFSEAGMAAVSWPDVHNGKDARRSTWNFLYDMLMSLPGLSPVQEHEWHHSRPRYDSWPPRRNAAAPARTVAQPILPLPGNSPLPPGGAEYDNEISMIPHDLTHHSARSEYSQPRNETDASGAWPIANAPFSLPTSNRTAELKPSPARTPRVLHLESELTAFPFVPETETRPETPPELGRAKSYRADVGYVHPKAPGPSNSPGTRR